LIIVFFSSSGHHRLSMPPARNQQNRFANLDQAGKTGPTCITRCGSRPARTSNQFQFSCRDVLLRRSFSEDGSFARRRISFQHFSFSFSEMLNA
jgi:hypothetical protein